MVFILTDNKQINHLWVTSTIFSVVIFFTSFSVACCCCFYKSNDVITTPDYWCQFLKCADNYHVVFSLLFSLQNICFNISF